ncbi:ArnT family glycosyltransferase [Thermopirellula anaerolimosa]
MPPNPFKNRLSGPLRSSAAIVLIAALAIRAGVIWGVPGGFAEDIDGYAAVADNLVQHGVFGYGERATAFRPPLYPVLLACVRATGLPWIWGAGILHLVLGLATVALAMSLARRLGLGREAWPAGVLTACDPLLLFHSRLLMTETLSAALLAATAWFATEAARRDTAAAWLCAGGLLGLNALARPTFLAWIPVAAAMLLLAGPRTPEPTDRFDRKKGTRRRGDRTDPRAWRRAGLTILGSVVVLLPWGARNAALFGSLVFGTTHGGYTLYLANNPDYYAYLQDADRRGVWDAAEFNRRWEAELRAAGVQDEPAADRLAYRLARRTIASQPGTFARACLGRLASFWGVLPSAGEGESVLRRWGRYAAGGLYAAELLAAAAGAWVLLRGRNVDRLEIDSDALAQGPGGHWGRSVALSWIVSAAVVLTLVHLFYWTNLRMRAPIMPLVAVFAAAGGATMRRLLLGAWRRASQCEA